MPGFLPYICFKIAPHHHTATSTFDCGLNIFFLESCFAIWPSHIKFKFIWSNNCILKFRVLVYMFWKILSIFSCLPHIPVFGVEFLWFLNLPSALFCFLIPMLILLYLWMNFVGLVYFYWLIYLWLCGNFQLFSNFS